MILTDYFLKKKIRSMAADAPSRDHAYRSLQDAGNIIILYSYEDKEAVQACIVKLEAMDKQVNACMYLPTGKNSGEIAGTLTVHADRDTDLMMMPKTEVAIQFTELPADVIIDFSRIYDHVLHYLLLNHSAPMRIGRKHPEFSLHDLELLVAPEEEIPELFEHILFYLQTIRSN